MPSSPTLMAPKAMPRTLSDSTKESEADLEGYGYIVIIPFE